MATPNPLAGLPHGAVFGHRGNSAHAPENTLPSFEAAIALGVDGLEYDVRLTRDGVAVVFHDATVDRTTNRTGPLAALSWAEVQQLDAGYRFTPDEGRTFPFRDRGIRVSRLADVLDAFPSHPVILEVKEPTASAEAMRVVLAGHAQARVTVGAFRHETLVPFDGGPIARTASTREVTRMYLPVLLGRRYTRLPFQSMSLPPAHHHIPVPLGRLSHAVAPAGVPVCAWTINDPAQAVRLWASGVRGVLSDDPGPMIRVRPPR